MSDLVLVDHPATGVVALTLNRPARHNALSGALLTQLGGQLAAASADPAARAIVITGADPAFCAGVDLDEISAGARFPEDAVQRFRSSPLPLIAAVNGAAITGGLELALACDLRIGSERARFADSHARFGFAPAWGMSARLPQVVGQGWARQISLTGEPVEAATALRIGLLNEVVPHDHLVERAVELAKAIARHDMQAVRTIRELYDTARDDGGSAAIAAEARVLAARSSH